MKNLVIFLLAVVAVVAGYYALVSNVRMSLEGLEGKTEKVVRGDLTLPIKTVGEIKPARRVEIKSEASGEVIEIARNAGDRVRKGELLIRLQKDDEQRNVDRAQLDLDVAVARMEESRLRFEQSQTADLDAAAAVVDQFTQQVRLSEYRWHKMKGLSEDQRNDEEVLQSDTSYRSLQAQLKSAQADFERAQLAIPRAEQSLKQAEATVASARTTLADAQKRLTKTDIVAPLDGIVGTINTQIGEVIQGGKTTLTGGTVLAVLLDMTKLIVRTEVDESDIGRVLAIAPDWATPGHDSEIRMPVRVADAAALLDHVPVITVDSFRDQTFEGVIERIYPEPRTGSSVVTYLIDVVLSSENQGVLLPGMRADVSFTSEHVANALLCPNEAIQEGPKGAFGVFVPKPGADPKEREVEFVPCVFGLDNGNYSEVRSGLDEDAVVYTKLPRKRDEDRKRG